MSNAQLVHRVGVILCGCQLELPDSRGGVRSHTGALEEHHAEPVLGSRVAGSSGRLQPTHGTIVVGCRSVATGVKDTQTRLARWIALLRGGREPTLRFGRLPRDAQSESELVTQPRLSGRDTCLGG